MENKRVPKIGETWLSNFGKLVTFFGRGTVLCQEQGHGPQFQVRGAIGERACGTCVTNARYGWTYISGPSDAPAKPALPQPGETWKFVGDNPHHMVMPNSFVIQSVSSETVTVEGDCCTGENREPLPPHRHTLEEVMGEATRVSPAPRITQAAVADELEKRAKDIPSPGFSVGDTSSPASADDGSHPEAARGGEAAVSRADTMAGCTESDMRPNWPALTHAGCSRSVACNVCVPPVKRVPWVDSLPVDWDLPDAV